MADLASLSNKYFTNGLLFLLRQNINALLRHLFRRSPFKRNSSPIERLWYTGSWIHQTHANRRFPNCVHLCRVTYPKVPRTDWYGLCKYGQSNLFYRTHNWRLSFYSNYRKLHNRSWQVLYLLYIPISTIHRVSCPQILGCHPWQKLKIIKCVFLTHTTSPNF